MGEEDAKARLWMNVCCAKIGIYLLSRVKEPETPNKIPQLC